MKDIGCSQNSRILELYYYESMMFDIKKPITKMLAHTYLVRMIHWGDTVKITTSKYIAKMRAKRCNILVPFPHGVNLTSERIFVRYITVSEAANS